MFGISINTQQKQKADSTGSPRSATAGRSPKVAVGSPRTVVGGSPWSVGSPRHLGSPKAKGSPKTVEVGEIDTRAPFQSVKAAVSLFGEGNASPRSHASGSAIKRTKSAEERVLLEKENLLHIALIELDAFKSQLRNSEATKAEALRELDNAKRTLQELAAQLGSINKSEQAAIDATESGRARVQQLEDEESRSPAAGIDQTERQEYIASATELNSVKQQLAELKQNFDAAMEVKMAAIHKASRAQNAAVVNRERVIELSKEVATLRQALAKLTSRHCYDEENAKPRAEKQASLKSIRMAKEEAEEKMQAIDKEFDPDLTEHLKANLDETNKAIEVLKQQLKDAKSVDMNAWKTAASELETAKKAMQEVVGLENSLRSQVDSLKLELENPEKPKIHPKEDDSGEMTTKIQQLSSEAEAALQEAEEVKKRAESFKKEAEMARIATKEAEEKLEFLLKEAKDAKATARLADKEMHCSSPAANLKLNGKIELSKNEYETLKKKAEVIKKAPRSKRTGITSCHSGWF